MTTSLNSRFGTATDLFKVIHEVSLQSGFLIRWEQTDQTIQLYKPDTVILRHLDLFGSIQYANYTDPTNVVWRFFYSQLSEPFKERLDIIRSRYWKTEYIKITPYTEWIDFTFYELTSDTLLAIKELKSALLEDISSI